MTRMKAKRDERAMDYVGFALAASAPLGGREALERFIRGLYSPRELEAMGPRKEDDRELANEMARAMRIRMIAERFGIQEVRE